MTRRELFAFVGILIVAIATLLVFGGGILWTRPLWFDELCCVVFVVRDASSPVDLIAKVARSWDYAPPLLHLIVWTVSRNSVAKWPDIGATSRTRGPGSAVALRKCSSEPNGVE